MLVSSRPLLADECVSGELQPGPGVLAWASVCSFSSVSVIPRCQSRFLASFNAVIGLTLLGAGTDGVGVGAGRRRICLNPRVTWNVRRWRHTEPGRGGGRTWFSKTNSSHMMPPGPRSTGRSARPPNTGQYSYKSLERLCSLICLF